MNWKLLIPFVLCLAVLSQKSSFASETNQPVTVVSPTDGSLWMATESEGLLRFGRNGRVLHYDFSAKSLVFDDVGTLYILDDSGVLTSYSSVEGFTQVESGVGALSESAGIPYIIKDNLLYSISAGETQLVRELPFSITSAEPLDLEYEIESSDSETEEKEPASSLWWLWIMVGLCLGLLLGFFIIRSRKAVEAPAPVIAPKVAPKVESKVESKVVPEVKPVVVPEVAPAPAEEEAPESAPVLSIEEALKASEFGKKVWSLVEANLSNAQYGVEQVADDLGISRIHVNRKLKAETGYSPSAVFKFIRMNHASKLLLEGKMTIADVATECGFASASYFSTAFKDYYKQSPSEFVASKSGETGTLNL